MDVTWFAGIPWKHALDASWLSGKGTARGRGKKGYGEMMIARGGTGGWREGERAEAYFYPTALSSPYRRRYVGGWMMEEGSRIVACSVYGTRLAGKGFHPVSRWWRRPSRHR